jgi:hypothetical protein
MEIIEVKKEAESTYKLIAQMTIDDFVDMPDEINKQKLTSMKFKIENMVSHKGYWFRPCFLRFWDGKKEVLEEPITVFDSLKREEP